jgi:outer membrane protein
MKYNIDARLADKNASEAESEKIKQDIETTIAASFLQVLLNKELLQITKEQLVVTEAKIEQRNAFIQSGKMAEGEVLELIAQQSTEEMNQLKAENNLKLSLLDLAQIMEIENFENLDIVSPENLSETDLLLLTPELVYTSALGHRPEIKSAEYQLKGTGYAVKIAQANYYPSLSLGAQVGTGYYKSSGIPNNAFGTQLNDNMSSGVGLSLQIPIFNKFEVRNAVHSAKIAVESSKLEINNAKIELKKAIQQAYYNAVGAKSRWEAAQKSEVASREAYRFTNQKFEAGRATTYELYQAKNNLTQVISEEAQSKYEYFFRVKLLELYK